jgi:hypothetical protein
MFDDLSFEGTAAAHERLLRDREARAADYAFAIDVISQASTLPPDEARKFVATRRAERMTAPRAPDLGVDVSVLGEYLRQLTVSPERAVVAAQTYRDVLERQRQRLVRHLAR